MLDMTLDEILSFMNPSLCKASDKQIELLEKKEQGKARLICNLSKYSIGFLNVDDNRLKYIRPGNCADNIVFQRIDEDNWNLKIIEFKTTVNDKHWAKVKLQFRGAVLNSIAISKLLGIKNIQEIELYTAFRNDKLSEREIRETTNPIFLKPLVGKENPNKSLDWNNEYISIDLKNYEYRHSKIKLDEEGNGSIDF